MAYARGMRISGGLLRGRVVRAPKSGVRPTQDSVREAVFAMLQPALGGCRFLDLYAGTGAVGLEAASRGAGAVWWVEHDARVHALLQRNVETLTPALGTPPPELRCVRADAFIFLKKSLACAPFDIIFADPPYSRPGDRAAGAGLAEQLLRAVRESGGLRVGGLFVMEARAPEAAPPHVGWELIRERRYGKTLVWVYRQTGAEL